MGLENRYSTIEAEEKNRQIIFSRQKKLRDRVLRVWDNSIDAHYSLCGVSSYSTSCFIYLDKDAGVEITRKAVACVTRHFGKMQRDFSSESGVFAWELKEKEHQEDEHGKYRIQIYIENAHREECKIIQKKVEVIQYEAICPGD